MRFLTLATDYDGTLAHDGIVSPDTIACLEKLRNSGRKLVLVSGRLLDDLLRVFPRQDLFDWIVGENGALLYSPQTHESRLLAEPVPLGFVDALRARGVDNVGAGQSIVGTWHPHECTVLEVLRDLGLDRQIIFNKGAVMVLPTGINKASGLLAALNEMEISVHNVVAIGDAENDLPMLGLCECGVAVSNALDSVKVKADMVTDADHGAGVAELIDELLKDDLARRFNSLHSRGLLLGIAKGEPGRSVLLPSQGQSLLVAGPSGSGKSTVVTGLIERMASAGYQFCLFDPEGDYEGFEPAINLGNPHYVPAVHEVLTLLERMHNAVVNLLGVSLDNRPGYVSEVMRALEHLRAETGRPHWLIFDEAHHLFPEESPAESSLLAAPPKSSLMLTVHPRHMGKEALASADIVMAAGKDPHETISGYCSAAGVDEPQLQPMKLEQGEVLVWFRHRDAVPFVVKFEQGKAEHKRHIRKYAEGDMGEGSFVFTGPDQRLRLRAHNLDTFVRMGRGVDEDTWTFHLRAHHYSDWIRRTIKDDELAEKIKAIENEARNQEGRTEESREQIFSAICKKYTAPA